MNQTVPYYFTPRPYQRAAWDRRLSGKYDAYFQIWHRQAGKDTDLIQFANLQAYLNPGTQSVYVGLDNKWIRRNIWDKYLDGRRHFDSYPKWDEKTGEGVIDIKETAQQIRMMNNPDDLGPAILQFLGFKESESAIGSSYDNFYISELSLYKRGAFDYMSPIWDNKRAMGHQFSVNPNFTPRGLNNPSADMLKEFTGIDEPEFWPGEHKTALGLTYVDVLRADQSEVAPGVRLYSDEQLEHIRQRYIRRDGNDAAFRQEMMVEFTAQNAGLVFPGIEVLKQEGRLAPQNLDTSKPVYMVWDISSKDKKSDWTSCIVFQYINNHVVIYDIYEDNRKSVVECVQELSKRDYFHLITAAALPWDSDRSGSRFSPLEECQQMFPKIDWYKLDRTFVADGINNARSLFPNLLINSDLCGWLVECFESWEYKWIESRNDTADEPQHNRYSHLMDAFRYLAEMIRQIPFIKSMGTTGRREPMPTHYRGWGQQEQGTSSWDDMPVGMRPSKLSPLRNTPPDQLYKMNENGLWVTREGADFDGRPKQRPKR